MIDKKKKCRGKNCNGKNKGSGQQHRNGQCNGYGQKNGCCGQGKNSNQSGNQSVNDKD